MTDRTKAARSSAMIVFCVSLWMAAVVPGATGSLESSSDLPAGPIEEGNPCLLIYPEEPGYEWSQCENAVIVICDDSMAGLQASNCS